MFVFSFALHLIHCFDSKMSRNFPSIHWFIASSQWFDSCIRLRDSFPRIHSMHWLSSSVLCVDSFEGPCFFHKHQWGCQNFMLYGSFLSTEQRVKNMPKPSRHNWSWENFAMLLCVAMLCHAFLCFCYVCAILCYVFTMCLLYFAMFLLCVCYALLCFHYVFAVVCYAFVMCLLCFAMLCHMSTVSLLCFAMCSLCVCYVLLRLGYVWGGRAQGEFYKILQKDKDFAIFCNFAKFSNIYSCLYKNIRKNIYIYIYMFWGGKDLQKM